VQSVRGYITSELQPYNCQHKRGVACYRLDRITDGWYHGHPFLEGQWGVAPSIRPPRELTECRWDSGSYKVSDRKTLPLDQVTQPSIFCFSLSTVVPGTAAKRRGEGRGGEGCARRKGWGSIKKWGVRLSQSRGRYTRSMLSKLVALCAFVCADSYCATLAWRGVVHYTVTTSIPSRLEWTVLVPLHYD